MTDSSTTPSKPWRPPYPSSPLSTVQAKEKASQNLLDTRNPTLIAEAYFSPRTASGATGRTISRGRPAIITFLTEKWTLERCYRLRKELSKFILEMIGL